MTREAKFEGDIGRTIADSKPWFDEPPHPGFEAPNVVVILLDDTGFAQLGCYGSGIDTPNIDRLASQGLQFTNFHVAPLCSPTRAALLTGRSAHAVGMRAVSNFRTGFPNMTGHISNHAMTMAVVLREQGYATMCVGKWHLAPMEQCSAAGPFENWPLAKGFDRFYGFLEGETEQFHPDLTADNHPVEQPYGPEDGYHLSEDLVDQSLKMISDARGIRPDRPFFTYLAFGASQEGGPFGVMHEMKFFNGILETPDEAIERIDDIGGPHSHTNYPWGWAQAGNTPFRWYKQNTHEGGVHVPMIMHWPNGTHASEQGTLRDQFVYVSDIAPTIYELLDIEAPEVYRGLEQLPITGHSFAELLNDADCPATNTLQLFEMAGSRALVHHNFKAVCKHNQGADYETEKWELYDLAADPSECNDLSDEQPERLSELIDLWWQEAERHGVMPLDDRMIELFGARFRDGSPHPRDKKYVYRPPMSPIPAQASAQIGGRNFDLTASVDHSDGDEGVLFATGTENSGLSLFVQDGRLVFDYNAFDDHSIIASDTTVPNRECELTLRMRRGDGRAGTAEILVDGASVGSIELQLYMRIISSVGASVGNDHGSPVSQRYQAPYPYSGTLDNITIQLLSKQTTEAAEAEARSEMSRQ